MLLTPAPCFYLLLLSATSYSLLLPPAPCCYLLLPPAPCCYHLLLAVISCSLLLSPATCWYLLLLAATSCTLLLPAAPVLSPASSPAPAAPEASSVSTPSQTLHPHQQVWRKCLHSSSSIPEHDPRTKLSESVQPPEICWPKTETVEWRPAPEVLILPDLWTSLAAPGTSLSPSQ